MTTITREFEFVRFNLSGTSQHEIGIRKSSILSYEGDSKCERKTIIHYESCGKLRQITVDEYFMCVTEMLGGPSLIEDEANIPKPIICDPFG